MEKDKVTNLFDVRYRLHKQNGLMVRECSNEIGSSEQYLRLAVQKRSAVDVLARALYIELSLLRNSDDALIA
jgi:histidinol-phosphate/aromatic aminotransferase/cobyric acid decarboxylase-like protein